MHATEFFTSVLFINKIKSVIKYVSRNKIITSTSNELFKMSAIGYNSTFNSTSRCSLTGCKIAGLLRIGLKTSLIWFWGSSIVSIEVVYTGCCRWRQKYKLKEGLMTDERGGQDWGPPLHIQRLGMGKNLTNI